MLKRTELVGNAYFIFLPFLILYTLIIVMLNKEEMLGDEGRYYQFSQNLISGFYSPPSPNINLWNGPGYPLFLVPFVLFKTPSLLITLFNGLFQYLSVVFLYKGLRQFVSGKIAVIFATFWGLYYISYQNLPEINTEPITIFLVSSFCYYFLVACSENRLKDIVVSGFLFGFLVLTKIVFGYVLLFVLLISGILSLFSKRSFHRTVLLIFVLAFCLNLPYLIYTKGLTDKFFYWGNSGGMSLYWMSTPIEGEFGDWNSENLDAYCEDPSVPCNSALFAVNHKAEMDYINSVPSIFRDDLYKDFALRNIKAHPVKYIKNCISNLGRMFFGIPLSYVYQRDRTLIRILPGSLILFLMSFSVFVSILNWRNISAGIKYILLLLLFYLFLSTLVSAYPRQLFVVIPLILLWSGFILYNTIRVNFKFKTN